MASDVAEMPFVKQLASNDRPTRDKALSSLRTYLTSNRTFTPLELLKLWKGLFFCIWHTDRPLPQQHLATTLSSLLLPLPPPLFLPYLHAFWTTLSHSWSTIDSLRLNKYLLLVRRYIHASFLYLLNHGWDRDLVAGYVELVEAIPLSVGAEAAKVPDGLRYHVLDCWVDELQKVDGGRGGPWGELMRPVRRVEREGATRVVRGRAREVLGDGRLKEGAGKGDGVAEGEGGPDGGREGGREGGRRGEIEDEKDGDEDGVEEEWGGFDD